MANEERTTWRWPLIRVSQDKRGQRTAVPPAGTYELTGIDGSLDGGLRPHMGFKHVRDLQANLYTDIEPVSSDAISRQSPACTSDGDTDCFEAPEVNDPQEINGFFPFTLRVTSSQVAWGFLWRVVDSADSSGVRNTRYFLEYRLVGDTTWYGPYDLIGWQTNGDQTMDVQTVGRFLYIGVKGSVPVRVWIEANEICDSSGTDSSQCVAGSSADSSDAVFNDTIFTLRVEENTGPGDNPKLKFVEGVGIETQADAVSYLTLPVDVPSSSEPAAARIIYFGFRNGNTNAQQSGTDSSGSIVYSLGLTGPSNLQGAYDSSTDAPLYDSATGPPQDDPSFEGVKLVWPDGTDEILSTADDDVVDASGGVIQITPDSVIAWDKGDYEVGDPYGLAAEDVSYTFAYQLFDSRTGLRSNISKVIDGEVPFSGTASKGGSIKQGSIIYSQWTGGYVADRDSSGSLIGVKTNSEGDPIKHTISGTWYNDFTPITFPAIDITYDADKFDTLLIYRSLPFEEGEGTTAEYQLMSLDNTIKLSNYQVKDDAQPSTSGWQRAVYWLTLSDAAISQQESVDTEFTYDSELPTAGAIHFYEGTMLYGNIGSIDNDVGGVSSFRWSSLLEVSTELVSPFARQTLELPAEQVLAWQPLGPNVVGLSDQGTYMVRKEGITLRGFPLHLGFGVSGDRASANIGSFTYYATDKGLKRLSSQGQLADETALDQVFIDEWSGNMTNVQMAYDAKQSVLYIHNPDLDHSLLFWFNNQRISELRDCPWTHVRQGDIPRDPSAATSPFERRAAFLAESRTFSASAGAVNEGYAFRVYVVDAERERGNTRLMDVVGDSIVFVESITNFIQFDGTHKRVAVDVDGSANANIGPRVSDCYVYVLDGPQAGKSQKCLRRAGASALVFESDGDIDWESISADTRLGVSPVYLRWVAGVAAKQDERDVPTGVDYFQTRHLSTLRCSFVNVSGDVAGTDDARFAAIVYDGNDSEPEQRVFPKANDGSQTASVVDKTTTGRDIGLPAAYTSGDSSDEAPRGVSMTSPCPGVEVFVPDLDYRLLEVWVDGKMLGTTSASRTEVT